MLRRQNLGRQLRRPKKSLGRNKVNSLTSKIGYGLGELQYIFCNGCMLEQCIVVLYVLESISVDVTLRVPANNSRSLAGLLFRVWIPVGIQYSSISHYFTRICATEICVEKLLVIPSLSILNSLGIYMK
jgi:hypothetical protein